MRSYDIILARFDVQYLITIGYMCDICVVPLPLLLFLFCFVIYDTWTKKSLF